MFSHEPGDCMFAIVGGEMEIHVNGVVDRLKAGNIFGEMAMIDAEPRSGTAPAATERLRHHGPH
ncbi:MAG: cyclic nucleotide-binding domain-containing protein [Gammaproteobacteria bacterium]|nr:cyclic nucleotide-binding domain-containing protein [Gammaproteobacteria bacterium]